MDLTEKRKQMKKCPNLEGRCFSERTVKLIKRTYEPLYSEEEYRNAVARLISDVNGKVSEIPLSPSRSTRSDTTRRELSPERYLPVQRISSTAPSIENDNRVLDIANFVFVAPTAKNDIDDKELVARMFKKKPKPTLNMCRAGKKKPSTKQKAVQSKIKDREKVSNGYNARTLRKNHSMKDSRLSSKEKSCQLNETPTDVTSELSQVAKTNHINLGFFDDYDIPLDVESTPKLSASDLVTTQDSHLSNDRENSSNSFKDDGLDLVSRLKKLGVRSEITTSSLKETYNSASPQKSSAGDPASEIKSVENKYIDSLESSRTGRVVDGKDINKKLEKMSDEKEEKHDLQSPWQESFSALDKDSVATTTVNDLLSEPLFQEERDCIKRSDIVITEEELNKLEELVLSQHDYLSQTIGVE